MFIKIIVCLFCVFTVACSSKSVVKDESKALRTTDKILEDGTIVRIFDVNQDGEPDVWDYYLEEASNEDVSVMTRRLIKKEIDVNQDGTKNVKRTYTEDQTIQQEDVDVDLNGKVDIVNHYDKGVLTKKDVFDAEEKKVTTRYYGEQSLVIRVEKDTNDDSKIDYWEYYEAGVLDRIGRDKDGDGRADSWQTR